MPHYEYLLLQKRLDNLLASFSEWKVISEHLKTVQKINITKLKIQSLNFLNN